MPDPLERTNFAERLRSLLPDFYSSRASFHHYSLMARGNFREYLHGETVWRKKYFYVLRPLLAMLWIESGRGPVPIEFQRLVDATVPDVATAIDELLEAKRAGAELDRGPVVPVLSGFIEKELTRLEHDAPDQVQTAPTVEKLDDVFRSVLRDAWERRPDPGV